MATILSVSLIRAYPIEVLSFITQALDKHVRNSINKSDVSQPISCEIVTVEVGLPNA
jgi:hypothetical protein